MFSRMKEHAVKMEQDLQYLETALDLKWKTIFSVTKQEVSESSVKFFDELIVELETINSNVETAIAASKKSNEHVKNENNKITEVFNLMNQDVDALQRHLEEYSYIKNSTINGDDTNDFLRYESMAKQDV